MDNLPTETIIKTLDNTPRVLFWGVDEFLLMVGPLFIGMAFGYLSFMLLGFVLKRFYNRLKKRYPRGHFQHIVYWKFPIYALKASGVLKRFPPSHYREFRL